MAKLTPQQISEKWANALANASTSIQAGVNNVQTAPSQKAIAKKDKMIQNWTQSVQSGRWERALGQVTLQDWKRSMLEKGVPRIASGANAAKPKFASFMTEFLPVLDAAKQEIEAMPDLTLEDNINRMTAFIRQVAKFKRS